MTADCRDDKDIKKQFRRQNALEYDDQEVLICTYGGKIQLFKSYCYLMYGCAFWCHSYQELLENLLPVIVTHSNDLLMSSDTPARVWHLR